MNYPLKLFARNKTHFHNNVFKSTVRKKIFYSNFLYFQVKRTTLTSSIIKTQEQKKKPHPQPLNQSSFMSKLLHKTNNLFHSPIQSLLHKSVTFVLKFLFCEQRKSRN